MPPKNWELITASEVSEKKQGPQAEVIIAASFIEEPRDPEDIW